MVELFEPRMLFAAPTLAAIPNVTLVAGAPLQIPLDGFDADSGDTLSYSVSAPAGLTATLSNANNRSMKISVSHASSGATDPAFSGDMVLSLFEDKAPRTTARIISLAQSGFYNGLNFHRVYGNFVIQGGDPLGNGTGGSGTQFDDEFDPNLRFTGTGLLAMAKSYDDTNDSQFFITEGPQRSLDFNHTIFGQLVEGDGIRDLIGNVAVDNVQHGMPISPVKMTAVNVFADKQNRVLTISVPPGTTGSAIVTVTVNDGHGSAPAMRSFTVTVAGETFNDPPYLLPVPDVVTRANTPVNVQISASDVNADGIAYLNWAGLYNIFSQHIDTTPVLLIPPDNQPPNGARDIDVNVDFNTGLTTVTPKNNVAGVFPMYVGVAFDDTAYDSQIVPMFISPAAPTVDLVDASDTGVSASDNITKLNNAAAGSKLQFQVNNVVAGAVVTLMDGATQIGQATVAAGATSVTITTSGTSAWANGQHNITAVQALNNVAYHIGNRIGTITLTSLASGALAVTVDTVAPSQTVGPAFSFAGTAQSLNYSFSEDVSASLMAGDITLLNRTTSATIPAASIRVGYAGNVGMFICSDAAGHYLADGDYRATIVGSAITDVAGNALPVGTAFDFFVLAADADHNRTVDFNDLVPLAQNYNTSGKTFAQGDYNYDGNVDFNDLVLLAQRYNTTLAAPPVAAPLAVAANSDVASAIAVTSPAGDDKGNRKGVFSDVPVKKAVPPKPKAPARPTHR